ncbi:scabin-related ADP-ribosyltransferase [Kitasatospora sp. NPDC001660]
MSIHIPDGLAKLFHGLTGMAWPEADEDKLRLAGDDYLLVAQDMPQLEDYIRDLTAYCQEQVSGRTGDGFADMAATLISIGGGSALAEAAEQANQLGKVAHDTANQVEYTKWMIIGQLVQLAAEIAWAIAAAPFTAGASLGQIVAARLVAEGVIRKILSWLLDRIVMHTFVSIAGGVMMDTIIQLIQIEKGHKSEWDTKSLLQAVEFGALNGLIGGPLGLIGGGLTKLFRGVIGKSLGKEAGRVLGGDLAKVSNGLAKDSLAGVLSKDGLRAIENDATKALGTDLGRTAENSLADEAGHSAAGAAARDAAKGAENALAEEAAHSAAGAAARDGEKWLAKESAEAFGNDLAQTIGRYSHDIANAFKGGLRELPAQAVARFEKDVAQVFEKHFGSILGKEEAAALGKDFARAMAENGGRGAAEHEALRDAMRAALKPGELSSEGVDQLLKQVPGLLDKVGGDTRLFKVGMALGGYLGGGVQNGLTEGFYNLTFGPDHKFSVSWESFVSGMAMGFVGHMGHLAVHPLVERYKTWVSEKLSDPNDTGPGTQYLPWNHPLTILSAVANLTGRPTPFPVPRPKPMPVKVEHSGESAHTEVPKAGSTSTVGGKAASYSSSGSSSSSSSEKAPIAPVPDSVKVQGGTEHQQTSGHETGGQQGAVKTSSGDGSSPSAPRSSEPEAPGQVAPPARVATSGSTAPEVPKELPDLPKPSPEVPKPLPDLPKNTRVADVPVLPVAEENPTVGHVSDVLGHASEDGTRYSVPVDIGDNGRPVLDGKEIPPEEMADLLRRREAAGEWEPAAQTVEFIGSAAGRAVDPQYVQHVVDDLARSPRFADTQARTGENGTGPAVRSAESAARARAFDESSADRRTFGDLLRTSSDGTTGPSGEHVPPPGLTKLHELTPAERAEALRTLPNEQRQALARDAAVIESLKRLGDTREFAETAAHLMVDVDPRTAEPGPARREAVALLARMLQDRDVALRLLEAEYRVHIVPRDVPITDAGPLAHLGGRQGRGAASAGRSWDSVRGAGGNHTVVTEENLLGERTTIGPASNNYADGYSTTTHEFAHSVLNVLSPHDREIVRDAYRDKLAGGDRVHWTDGPRRGERGDTYASRSEHEYFAQLTNAYLGTNRGHDPHTGAQRNNGPGWVRRNESPEVSALLRRLYGDEPLPGHENRANPVRLNEGYEGVRHLLGDGDAHLATESAHEPQPRPEHGGPVADGSALHMPPPPPWAERLPAYQAREMTRAVRDIRNPKRLPAFDEVARREFGDHKFFEVEEKTKGYKANPDDTAGGRPLKGGLFANSFGFDGNRGVAVVAESYKADPEEDPTVARLFASDAFLVQWSAAYHERNGSAADVKQALLNPEIPLAPTMPEAIFHQNVSGHETRDALHVVLPENGSLTVRPEDDEAAFRTVLETDNGRQTVRTVLDHNTMSGRPGGREYHVSSVTLSRDGDIFQIRFDLALREVPQEPHMPPPAAPVHTARPPVQAEGDAASSIASVLDGPQHVGVPAEQPSAPGGTLAEQYLGHVLTGFNLDHSGGTLGAAGLWVKGTDGANLAWKSPHLVNGEPKREAQSVEQQGAVKDVSPWLARAAEESANAWRQARAREVLEDVWAAHEAARTALSAASRQLEALAAHLPENLSRADFAAHRERVGQAHRDLEAAIELSKAAVAKTKKQNNPIGDLAVAPETFQQVGHQTARVEGPARAIAKMVEVLSDDRTADGKWTGSYKALRNNINGESRAKIDELTHNQEAMARDFRRIAARVAGGDELASDILRGQRNDAEVNVMRDVYRQLDEWGFTEKNAAEARGSLVVVSSQGTCDSCKFVVQDVNTRFPHLDVFVAYAKPRPERYGDDGQAESRDLYVGTRYLDVPIAYGYKKLHETEFMVGDKPVYHLNPVPFHGGGDGVVPGRSDAIAEALATPVGNGAHWLADPAQRELPVGTQLREALGRLPHDPGAFTVAYHSTRPDGVPTWNGEPVSVADAVAALVKLHGKEWPEGTPLRFLACRAGRGGENSFAAAVLRGLRVQLPGAELRVIATRDLAVLLPDSAPRAVVGFGFDEHGRPSVARPGDWIDLTMTPEGELQVETRPETSSGALTADQSPVILGPDTQSSHEQHLSDLLKDFDLDAGGGTNGVAGLWVKDGNGQDLHWKSGQHRSGAAEDAGAGAMEQQSAVKQVHPWLARAAEESADAWRQARAREVLEDVGAAHKAAEAALRSARERLQDLAGALPAEPSGERFTAHKDEIGLAHHALQEAVGLAKEAGKRTSTPESAVVGPAVDPENFRRAGAQMTQVESSARAIAKMYDELSKSDPSAPKWAGSYKALLKNIGGDTMTRIGNLAETQGRIADDFRRIADQVTGGDGLAADVLRQQRNDAEVNVMRDVYRQLDEWGFTQKNASEARGSLVVVSSQGTCDSCKFVVQDVNTRFPHLDVVVAYAKPKPESYTDDGFPESRQIYVGSRKTVVPLFYGYKREMETKFEAGEKTVYHVNPMPFHGVADPVVPGRSEAIARELAAPFGNGVHWLIHPDQREQPVGAQLRESLATLPHDPGTFALAYHSSRPDGAPTWNGEPVSVQDTVAALAELYGKQWSADTPLRFLACHAGRGGENSFAAQVLRGLGEKLPGVTLRAVATEDLVALLPGAEPRAVGGLGFDETGRPTGMRPGEWTELELAPDGELKVTICGEAEAAATLGADERPLLLGQDREHPQQLDHSQQQPTPRHHDAAHLLPAPDPETVAQVARALAGGRTEGGVHVLADPLASRSAQAPVERMLNEIRAEEGTVTLGYHSVTEDGAPGWNGKPLPPHELAAALAELHDGTSDRMSLRFLACDAGRGREDSYAAQVLRALRERLPGVALDLHVPDGKLWLFPGAEGPRPVVASRVGWDANGVPRIEEGGAFLHLELPAHEAGAVHVTGTAPHPDAPAPLTGATADHPITEQRDLQPLGVPRKGALHATPQHQERAERFEQRLGELAYRHPKAVAAARNAVARLYEALRAAHPEVPEEQLYKVFLKDDDQSAGQVGERLSLAEFREMMATGNTRELMTAFFNAAYNKNSGLGLKSVLQHLLAHEDPARVRAMGLDQRELRSQTQFLNGGVRAVLEKVPGLSGMFGKDHFGTGNVINRSREPLKAGAEYLASLNARKDRAVPPNALRADELAQRGMALSGRELRFQQPNGGHVTALRWKSGRARYELNGKADWYGETHLEKGMPVTTGVSATTAKMMNAFLLLRVPHTEPQDMLLALVGWMLPLGDHSLYEILQGARMVDGLPPLPEHALSDVSAMYRHIPGLPQADVRRDLGENGMLPHEAAYHHLVGTARSSGGYFSEENGAAGTNRSRFEQAAANPNHGGDDVRIWLQRHGLSARDVLDRLTIAHFEALALYTGDTYPLINVALRFGPLTRRAALEVQVRSMLDGGGTLPAIIRDDTDIRQAAALTDPARRKAALTAAVPALVKRMEKELLVHAELIGESLEKIPSLRGDVYRGERVAGPLAGGLAGKLSPAYGGKTFESSGFLSTSRDERVAERFMNGGRELPFTHRALIHFTLTGGGSAHDIQPFSAVGREDEVLIEPGRRFTVDGRLIPSGARVPHERIDVTELPQDRPFPKTTAEEQALHGALARLANIPELRTADDLWPLARHIGADHRRSVLGRIGDLLPNAAARREASLHAWHVAGLTRDLAGGTGELTLAGLTRVRRAADLVRESLGLPTGGPVTRGHLEGYARELDGPAPGAATGDGPKRLVDVVDVLKRPGQSVTAAELKRAWSVAKLVEELRGTGQELTPDAFHQARRTANVVREAFGMHPTLPVTRKLVEAYVRKLNGSAGDVVVTAGELNRLLGLVDSLKRPGHAVTAADLRRAWDGTEPVPSGEPVTGGAEPAPALEPVAADAGIYWAGDRHPDWSRLERDVFPYLPNARDYLTLAMHTRNGVPVLDGAVVAPAEIADGLRTLHAEGAWDGVKPLRFMACDLNAAGRRYAQEVMEHLWDAGLTDAVGFAADAPVWFAPALRANHTRDLTRAGLLVATVAIGRDSDGRPVIDLDHHAWYRLAHGRPAENVGSVLGGNQQAADYGYGAEPADGHERSLDGAFKFGAAGGEAMADAAGVPLHAPNGRTGVTWGDDGTLYVKSGPGGEEGAFLTFLPEHPAPGEPAAAAPHGPEHAVNGADGADATDNSGWYSDSDSGSDDGHPVDEYGDGDRQEWHRPPAELGEAAAAAFEARNVTLVAGEDLRFGFVPQPAPGEAGRDMPAEALSAAAVPVDPEALPGSQEGIDVMWRRDDALLFRWEWERTSEPYSDVFETGFLPKAPDRYVDLEVYKNENPPSAFVSTTRSDTHQSAGWGTSHRYLIDAPGGIDVRATFEHSPLGEAESEVAFPGGIDGKYIVGVELVYDTELDPATGRYASTVEFVPNPYYWPDHRPDVIFEMLRGQEEEQPYGGPYFEEQRHGGEPGHGADAPTAEPLTAEPLTADDVWQALSLGTAGQHPSSGTDNSADDPAIVTYPAPDLPHAAPAGWLDPALWAGMSGHQAAEHFIRQGVRLTPEQFDAMPQDFRLRYADLEFFGADDARLWRDALWRDGLGQMKDDVGGLPDQQWTVYGRVEPPEEDSDMEYDGDE